MFFKFADVVIFPTDILYKVQKVANLFLVWHAITENNVYVPYHLIKYGDHALLISKRVFHRFLLNYTNFEHATPYIQPSKYDSAYGTNICVWRRVGVMWTRYWTQKV